MLTSSRTVTTACATIWVVVTASTALTSVEWITVMAPTVPPVAGSALIGS
jgi:hypothetical protein